MVYNTVHVWMDTVVNDHACNVNTGIELCQVIQFLFRKKKKWNFQYIRVQFIIPSMSGKMLMLYKEQLPFCALKHFFSPSTSSAIFTDKPVWWRVLWISKAFLLWFLREKENMVVWTEFWTMIWLSSNAKRRGEMVSSLFEIWEDGSFR